MELQGFVKNTFQPAALRPPSPARAEGSLLRAVCSPLEVVPRSIVPLSPWGRGDRGEGVFKLSCAGSRA
jgi:hypothetical protein